VCLCVRFCSYVGVCVCLCVRHAPEMCAVECLGRSSVCLCVCVCVRACYTHMQS
jgi:hypothetical protein